MQFLKNILFGFILTLAFGSSLSDLDIKVVLQQPLVTPSPDVVATALVLTFSPGDEGSPPHFHSGPVVGYVLEGSLLFQVRHIKDILFSNVMLLLYHSIRLQMNLLV